VVTAMLRMGNYKPAKRAFMNRDRILRKTFLEEELLYKQKLTPQSGGRIRNRCILTGRNRGIFRIFKLSRIKIRELAFELGLRNASW